MPTKKRSPSFPSLPSGPDTGSPIAGSIWLGSRLPGDFRDELESVPRLRGSTPSFVLGNRTCSAAAAPETVDDPADSIGVGWLVLQPGFMC